MRIPEKNLVVTNQTTATELSNFLKTGGDKDHQKLVGKNLGDGKTVIYFKANTKSSLFDRVRQQSDKRRNVARDAVATVFKNVEKTAITKFPPETARNMIEKLTTELTKLSEHALRQDSISKLANAMSEIEKSSNAKPKDPLASMSSFSTGNVLGHINLLAVVKQLESANSREDIQRITRELGDALYYSPTETGQEEQQLDLGKLDVEHKPLERMPNFNSAQTVELFLSKDFERVKSDLTEFLSNQLGNSIKDEKHIGFDAIPQIVNSAVERLFEGIVGKSLSDEIPEEGEAVKPENFILNGKEYVPVKKLAEGSSGVAMLYENKDDKSDKLTVKIPTEDTQKTREIFKKELLAQAMVGQTGSDNVLGLSGVIKLPGGSLAMAMPYAPHGDLHGLAVAIKNLEGTGSGLLQKDLANLLRLTLLKDATSGLEAMHKSGLVHNDFKAPNCLIDSEGKVKVMDFGDTNKGEALNVSERPFFNPRYVAPEFMFGHQTSEKSTKEHLAKAKTDFKYLGDFIGGKSGVNAKLLAPITEEIKSDEGYKVSSQMNGLALDNWGLGVLAANLFEGDVIRPDVSHDTQFEHMYGNLMQERRPVIRPELEGGTTSLIGLVNSTGDDQIDSVLNGLLNQDVGSRWTTGKTLESEIFGRPGVGHEALRQLIPELVEMGKIKSELKNQEDQLSNATKNAISEKRLESESYIRDKTRFEQKIDEINSELTKKMQQFELTQVSVINEMNLPSLKREKLPTLMEEID